MVISSNHSLNLTQGYFFNRSHFQYELLFWHIIDMLSLSLFFESYLLYLLTELFITDTIFLLSLYLARIQTQIIIIIFSSSSRFMLMVHLARIQTQRY